MVCVSLLDEEDKHQDYVYALKDHYLMLDTEDFPGLSGETVPFSPSRHFEDMDYEFDPYASYDPYAYAYDTQMGYEEMEFWNNPLAQQYAPPISEPFTVPNMSTPNYPANFQTGFPALSNPFQSPFSNYAPPSTPQPQEDRHKPTPPPELSQTFNTGEQSSPGSHNFTDYKLPSPFQRTEDVFPNLFSPNAYWNNPPSTPQYHPVKQETGITQPHSPNLTQPPFQANSPSFYTSEHSPSASVKSEYNNATTMQQYYMSPYALQQGGHQVELSPIPSPSSPQPSSNDQVSRVERIVGRKWRVYLLNGTTLEKQDNALYEDIRSDTSLTNLLMRTSHPHWKEYYESKGNGCIYLLKNISTGRKPPKHELHDTWKCHTLSNTRSGVKRWRYNIPNSDYVCKVLEWDDEASNVITLYHFYVSKM